jgi:hypothetical protein
MPGIPEIIIDRNHVIICNQVVVRPSTIAPSQWIQFWETATRKENRVHTMMSSII